MNVKLIKTDRNGSKHFEGLIECDRCGGKGYYAIGVCNGAPVLSPHDAGVCWKCNGKGQVLGKWIERTPEYQAKLDAKRLARQAARRAEQAAAAAKREAEEAERKAQKQAEKEAREAEIKAKKAISQHVGKIGEKLEIEATYQYSGQWEQKAFTGYGTDTVYAHIFRDAAGNVLTWKTQKSLQLNEGDRVVIIGTVKDHTVYKDEKQTALSRCKVVGL